MWNWYNACMRSIDRFDLQDWLFIFLLVVLIGAFCMRGFGSRSNY